MSRNLEFCLPDVGEGLGEGEIVAWRVGVGDRVVRDQVLVEVETDKSIVELPSPSEGVIAELGGKPGDILPVGAVLVVMTVAGGSPGTSPDAPPQRVLASPATRKLAVELGVDLARVRGSGPGGRVRKEDVLTAAAPEPSPPAAPTFSERGVRVVPARKSTCGEADGEGTVERVPLRGVRRRVAQTMTRAWQQIPHITDFREVDATRLVAARLRLRDRLGPEFTYLPLFIAAVAAALGRHRALNASLDAEAETITYHRGCHIGIAIATDDGLIVPVLHDADRKSLAQIAVECSTLTQAARSRAVTAEQTMGGTFTITNFGSYGGWLGTPVIRPPEAGIAGFGRIHDAVIPVESVPAVRALLPMVVAADHRLVDGDALGRFAADLAELLADPVLLLA